MKKAIFTILAVTFFCSVYGQTIDLIRDTHISLEKIGGQATDSLSVGADPMAMDSIMSTGFIMTFNDLDEFKVSISLLLLDTANISNIHVKVGRSLGANDVFDGAFVYDNQNPGIGLSYFREKKYIILGLGNYINLRNVFIEVYIEAINGSVTPIFKKNIMQ